MKRLLLLVSLVGVFSFMLNADYLVHGVTGKVKAIRSGKILAVENGMELKSADEINIPEGGSIEILNTKNKKIYRSVKTGKTSIVSLMIDAQSQASDNAKSVHSNMGVFKGKKVNVGDRVYMEKGAVTRDFEIVDSISGCEKSLPDSIMVVEKNDLSVDNDSVPNSQDK